MKLLTLVALLCSIASVNSQGFYVEAVNPSDDLSQTCWQLLGTEYCTIEDAVRINYHFDIELCRMLRYKSAIKC